jgi:hypothetical protein
MQFTRGPIEEGKKAVLVKRAFQIEAGIVNHFANRWWQSVPHFGTSQRHKIAPTRCECAPLLLFLLCFSRIVKTKQNFCFASLCQLISCFIPSPRTCFLYHASYILDIQDIPRNSSPRPRRNCSSSSCAYRQTHSRCSPHKLPPTVCSTGVNKNSISTLGYSGSCKSTNNSALSFLFNQHRRLLQRTNIIPYS